jgi:hypothetical protein
MKALVVDIGGWMACADREAIDPVKVFEALAPAHADIVAWLRAVEADLTRIEGARSRTDCAPRSVSRGARGA